MAYINEYIQWKKKNLNKVLQNTMYEFDYSVEKNSEEIKRYLNADLSYVDLKKIEKEVEELEEVFFVKYNDKKIEYKIYLEEIKNKVKDNYKNMKGEFLKYITENAENIKENEGIICNLLFDNEIANNPQIIEDIYGYPYYFREKNFLVDNENKVIKRRRKDV